MWYWHELIDMLAIVSLFAAGWRYVGDALDGASLLTRRAVLGIATGAGAVAAMLLATEIADGVHIDFRNAFLAVGALFGGPVGAAAGAAIAILFLIATGAHALGAQIAALCLASLVGVAFQYSTRTRRASGTHILALSLLIAGGQWLALSIGPQSVAPSVVLMATAVSFGVTSLLGLVVWRRLASSDEARLMRAALHQSPDLIYVKDAASRITFANFNMASFHGVDHPQKLVGKTDFDLADADHARELFEEEQAMMRTGKQVLDRKESIIGSDGVQRWFESSKSAVYSADGRILGMAGVTREVTERRKIQAELEQSRNMLAYALSEMSDGLCMFDAHGIMVFCNDQMRNCFPETGDLLVPGVHYRAIFRAFIKAGKEVTNPKGLDEHWLNETTDPLVTHNTRDIRLSNGRWLKVRARTTGEGMTVVTVSDITEIRNAQDALMQMTRQLKELAATDWLTGLPNRREFDKAFGNAWRHARRNGTPLSLLVIDVDRFKRYNDLYGHLAGDTCLRTVASSLRQLVRRPGDLAARFGGEEFVLILPGTGEQAALKIAEKLRRSLTELEMPHEGSEWSLVTASIGLACMEKGEPAETAEELIRRADEALYQAKKRGRNRVEIWNAVDGAKRAAS